MNEILFFVYMHEMANKAREYFEQRPIENLPEDTVNHEIGVMSEIQGVLIGEIDMDLHNRQILLQRAVDVLGDKIEVQLNKQNDLGFDLAAAYARNW